MTAKSLLLIVGTCCALSACGTEVLLKNPQSGAVASCKGGAINTGMASKRVSDDLMLQCVDSYTQHGYEIVASKH
jgi:hypothetical protein